LSYRRTSNTVTNIINQLPVKGKETSYFLPVTCLFY